MTAAPLTLLILAAFLAGVLIGAFWRWIRALADEADEYDGYEPVENDPLPGSSWGTLQTDFNQFTGHTPECTYAQFGICNCTSYPRSCL